MFFDKKDYFGAGRINQAIDIIESDEVVLPQANVIKSVCVDCKEEFKPIDRCVACENNRSINY